MTKNKAARRCGNIDTRLNHSAAHRLQQQRKYTTTRRMRPVVRPRNFSATRREFDAYTKSTGRALVAAWWIAIAVMIVGMTVFGWGV